MNFLAQKRTKILLQNKNSIPPASNGSEQTNDFYYKEIAQLTTAGGWSIDFITKSFYLDQEARKLLNTPVGYNPTIPSSLHFYTPEYRPIAQKIFMDVSMENPYKGTIKMLTYNKIEFWARAIAKPVYNEINQVVGIQGIFQDITETKEKELHLENSLKKIEFQNTRLFNFANIVSHNLRSHASNLQLTAELLNSAESKEEERELKKGLNEISENINTTINHLNEIVAIQANAGNDRKTVSFREILLKVTHSLQDSIFSTDAEIYTDFSEVPNMEYIPAYLENIFLNLITNSIKFKHPSRKPIIDIFSYKDEDKVCLMVKDNGLGIDLEKHGSKIFNMYQTFHPHIDSNGVGLFVTKNQVEALQGTIEVESMVNVGTTFRIKF